MAIHELPTDKQIKPKAKIEMEKDGGKTYMRARRQEERFKRDTAVYNEFNELWEKHRGFTSKWKIAGLLGAYYRVNPVTVCNIVKRMGAYLEKDGKKESEEIAP